MNIKSIEKLIEQFNSIPGFNKKQSEKIAFYLANHIDRLKNLSLNLNQISSEIHKCSICNMISDDNICYLCSNNSREKQLMIVETTSDALKFEKANIYKGYYFILEKLFTSLNIADNHDDLLEKINHQLNDKKEVILAISPTLDGQITIEFLKQFILSKNNKLKISQLAIGLPLGSQIDYIDNTTLSQSFKNRKDK